MRAKLPNGETVEAVALVDSQGKPTSLNLTNLITDIKNIMQSVDNKTTPGGQSVNVTTKNKVVRQTSSQASDFSSYTTIAKGMILTPQIYFPLEENDGSVLENITLTLRTSGTYEPLSLSLVLFTSEKGFSIESTIDLAKEEKELIAIIPFFDTKTYGEFQYAVSTLPQAIYANNLYGFIISNQETYFSLNFYKAVLHYSFYK